jgi:hypothetical protein
MTFNKILAAATLGLLFSGTALAAVQTYSFNGTVESGSLLGETYSGTFSYDDASLTGSGEEWLAIDNLDMNFMGSNYTETDATAPAEVGYLDGVFRGLSYSVNTAANPFTFIAGTIDDIDAFFAYDATAPALSGTGNVIFAPVPEPGEWMMMLAGLGLVGLMSRCSRRQHA